MDDNLGDIYSRCVPKKGVHFSGLSLGNSSPQTERDPNLIKLENSVFGKIRELTKEEEQPIKKLPQNELKTYSVEDAIRELKELGEI